MVRKFSRALRAKKLPPQVKKNPLHVPVLDFTYNEESKHIVVRLAKTGLLIIKKCTCPANEIIPYLDALRAKVYEMQTRNEL